jgi:nicotinic acid mononucleotide adenylyltransferase
MRKEYRRRADPVHILHHELVGNAFDLPGMDRVIAVIDYTVTMAPWSFGNSS